MNNGGRIAGGAFARRAFPLGLALVGLGALALYLRPQAPPPVVINQQIHQDAPAQVFNAPVTVQVHQVLPEQAGRSSAALHQAMVQADQAVPGLVNTGLGALTTIQPTRSAEASSDDASP